MTQTGKGQSKSDDSLSSGSIVVYPDQLRSGDVEKAVGDKRDSTHEKSAGGRGPETV